MLHFSLLGGKPRSAGMRGESLPGQQRNQLSPRNHRRDPWEGAASLQSEVTAGTGKISLFPSRLGSILYSLFVKTVMLYLS